MDSNPPTAADYASHNANEALSENRKLSVQLLYLISRVTMLESRISQLESLHAKY